MQVVAECYVRGVSTRRVGGLIKTPRPWHEWLERYEDPGMDPAVEEALRDFVARRTRELTG